MFQHLIDRGLVKAKRYPEQGLNVYKYTGKVFYDALWNEDPLLLEARGMVLDDDGNVIIWPFTKVFNHHENGTECDPERLVDVIRKVNGFMAAVTLHKGNLLVSTTGTLDSEYAVLAKKVIVDTLDITAFEHGYTYIFEICDPSDPHIVDEEPGAYLIGMRVTDKDHACYGSLATEVQLDSEASELNVIRPHWDQMHFCELIESMPECRHEGYMVRDAWTDDVLMKIKSPHYLSKKFLMRMGQKKVDAMYENKQEFLQTIDEEFYTVVHYITSVWTVDEWKGFTDQERKARIEDFFDCTGR